MDDPLRRFATDAGSPTGAGDDEPFRDPDRPVDERVDDLLGRLDFEETAALLHNFQRPVGRLGVGPFRAGGEAVHGVSWMGEATFFPQPIGLGSTWDLDLVERVGCAAGDEVRGMNERTAGAMGLNVWCPVTDPLRDPRWGRNEEGYAEDPLLSGRASAAYASGLAGDDPDYRKTAPSLKHFAAYNRETDRTTTNAEIPPRLLHDYYVEFFRRAVESGDAVGVMASYNLINGRPMTASPLLSDPVREWTPDDRAVMNVSDGKAPDNLAGSQDYFDSVPAARAAALRAGLDSFSEGRLDNADLVDALATAVDEGHLDEEAVEEAAGHVLATRFRLGEFDPDDRNPYADLGPEVIGRPEHRELAREAAREATVLLKNDGALPLPDDGSVAVVGPLSDAVFTDWYSGVPPYRVTVRDGVRDRVGADAVEAATGADLVALRDVASGRYVTAVGHGGGQLHLHDDNHANRQFAAVQWTDDAWTLRAMANEQYVTVEEGTLVNDAAYPDGWETVSETFEFVDDGDAVVLFHHKSGEFVAVEDGRLVATAGGRSEAARFAVERRQGGPEAAAAAARAADRAVVVVGTHPLIGGRETTDRDSLALPAAQRALVEAVLDANDRTVVVLQSGNPVAAEWIDEHAPAVLWTAHAGQETGRALADVLFGDVSPAGRLTQTWPRSVDRLPPMTEYDVARANRTYRYGQEDPLYAFGHGLSYASFEYGDPRIEADSAEPDASAGSDGPTDGDSAAAAPGSGEPVAIGPGETATVAVEVRNVGSRASDEVVQLYTRQRESRTRQPEMELRGFERVGLDAGESRTVTFDLSFEDFAFWDVTRRRPAVEPSAHDVLVGSASDDLRAETTLRVDGEPIPDRDLSAPTRAADADDWSWSEITLLDRSKAAGTVVGLTDGAWVAFDDVALDARPPSLVASVARPAPDSGSGPGPDPDADTDANPDTKPDSKPGTVEVRRGGPDGRLLGSADLPVTGGVYEYDEVTVPLDWAGEGQRLTVAVRGCEARLDTVRFEEEEPTA
ncbi:MAG: glycoside hydrolase family 3 C-terminal domain-containing protein [Haloarculaceae archaeon]